MISVQTSNQKNKIVNIIYSNGASATVSASQLATAGRHLLDVVTLLEQQGYRVNVDIATIACVSKQTAICFVRVKDARRIINPLKLAYLLVHPSFFRRQGFRWIETYPGITDADYRIGYGYPLKFKVKNDTSCSSEREWLQKNRLLPKNTFYACFDEAYANEADELINVMGLK